MPRRTLKNTDPSIPGEPRYRLHKRSAQAVVTLSGKDIYLGRYGTPESADRYRAAVNEWVARGRRPAEPEAPPLSVAELALEYLKWATGYYRDHHGQTNEKELWNIKRAFRPLRESFAKTAARDFGPRKLELVQQRLIADGLSRPTVNRYVSRIKHLFKWGVSKEMLPPAVHQALACFEGLKRGRTDAPEPEPVRPVADALIDAVEPHVSAQVWAMISLQRCTGMRPGEVVIMRGCDIDMTGPVWLYRPQHHKTGYRDIAHTVMLGPKAQRIVRAWLKPDVHAYLFNPGEAEAERRAAATKERKTDRRWGNRPGTNRRRKPKRRPKECYTTTSYARAVARGCDAAFPPPDGLTDEQRAAWRQEHHWSPNVLRHNFGTTVRREHGLEACQVLLGHQRADITQVYAEADAETAAQVALKIG